MAAIAAGGLSFFFYFAVATMAVVMTVAAAVVSSEETTTAAYGLSFYFSSVAVTIPSVSAPARTTAAATTAVPAVNRFTPPKKKRSCHPAAPFSCFSYCIFPINPLY